MAIRKTRRQLVAGPTEIAAMYAAWEKEEVVDEQPTETLEQIADRVAPQGGKQATLKAAKARAKELIALEAALEQSRDQLNRAYAHHAALVDTYGEWSAEAREGAGRIAFQLQSVRVVENLILAIAPGRASVTAHRH